MMEAFERIDIQELPLHVPHFRRQVEDFLGSNGLRLEEVDLYLGVLDSEGHILAGGGLCGDLIKCIAVSASARSEGLSVPLVSRLISVASERGYAHVKVFTKPDNLAVFESLGFRLLARSPKAVFMENGRGLETYCSGLRSFRKPGRTGVIVMNANPFTLGHRYVVDQASREVGNLVVIPVKEDCSRFPYAERLSMLRQECPVVPDGSVYQISATTFPTYFLKDLSDAAETQMRLDIDLFGRYIAPALGADVRFVGSEPADPLTARYNELMQEILPGYGIRVVEIPRLCDAEGPVSATRVRTSLDQGRYGAAAALTPASTHPFLLADLAVRALTLEVDAPLKPGLVGPDSTGAHLDMDYPLMHKSITVLRPYFSRMAAAGSPEELRQLGIGAEKEMLQATGGVNTHRGAIFALGLALAAAYTTFASLPNLDSRNTEATDFERLMQNNLLEIARVVLRKSMNASELSAAALSHGAEAVRRYGVRGARELSIEGYKELFADWLPFYRSVRGDAWALQKTLLRIMSTLDDTCVIHRVGFDRAQAVKEEAGMLLKDFSVEKLKNMNARYCAEGVSPGGAADMLALTVLIDSLITQ